MADNQDRFDKLSGHRDKHANRDVCPKCAKKLDGFGCADCGWIPGKPSILPAVYITLASIVAAAVVVTAVLNVHKIWPDVSGAKSVMQAGNDFYSTGDLPMAVMKYEEAASLDPKSAAVRFRLSLALNRQGKYSAAAEQMAAAVALAPAEKKYLLGYAIALGRLGDHNDEALEQYEKYLKLFPDDLNVVYETGRAAERVGDFQEAERRFLQFCDKDPHKDGVWRAVARVQKQQGKSEVAVGTLQKALDSEPNSAFLHYDLAELLADLHRKPEATKEYERAAEIAPRFFSDAATARLEQMNGTADQKISLISLHRKFNSFLIDVVINEKFRGKFVVDSGADACVIKPEAARAAGINFAQGPAAHFLSASGVGTAKMAKIATLRVGDIREHDVIAFVNDMPGSYDGLLGMTFLGRFKVVLNPAKGILELTRKTHPDPKAK